MLALAPPKAETKVRRWTGAAKRRVSGLRRARVKLREAMATESRPMQKSTGD